MDVLPLVMTAVLVLLFNVIAYLKRGPVANLLLAVFLGAAVVACTRSPVLVPVVVFLVLTGIALVVTPGGARFALPASLTVAVLVHAVNGVYSPERAQLTDSAGMVDSEDDATTAFLEKVRKEREFKNWITEEERIRLREEFPFESLSARLAGERRSIHGLSDLASSAATRESWAHLDGLEFSFSQSLRTGALANLHADSVDQFVSRAGFGFSRMRTMPLPQDLSPGEDGSVLLTDRTIVELDEPDYTPPGVAPTADHMGPKLWNAHSASLIDFLDPADLGYVRGRDQVAGFRPHGFRRLPYYSPGEKGRGWRILKLELVGLLMHDAPLVYISEQLPSMKNAKQLPTRELDSFEKSALPALERGEDIVPVREGDTLRVLGSIRAAKKCLDCHEVKRGDLLGAFTYTLRKERQP